MVHLNKPYFPGGQLRDETPAAEPTDVSACAQRPIYDAVPFAGQPLYFYSKREDWGNIQPPHQTKHGAVALKLKSPCPTKNCKYLAITLDDMMIDERLCMNPDVARKYLANNDIPEEKFAPPKYHPREPPVQKVQLSRYINPLELVAMFGRAIYSLGTARK